MAQLNSRLPSGRGASLLALLHTPTPRLLLEIQRPSAGRFTLPILSPPPPPYHRLELLHSLDHTLYALFVLSYLLSPSHLLTLILRLASQVQFASPRHVHPGRPLRFFLAAWAVLNAGNVLVHAIDGSRGTKGRGWAGRGLLLDFVGQGHTPSRGHLLLLDGVIAALQFVLVLIAYGESTSHSPDGVGYSALLGEDERWENLDSDSEEPKPPSSSLPPADPLAQPILNIRLRAVWRELRTSGTGEVDASGRIRGMEEGRPGAG